ncbi:NADPH:quinone oxidoreductase [Chelatococcus reniformis]|uniref:NADPH:quinone oxidoreductase n=2 Tax=Chelatococcus reniformis TaxID=1494448 RepID=A0A916UEW3_9HYPH|nr:NADPH:quinone oxidoreductase [Chelatococcus reniformis]
MKTQMKAYQLQDASGVDGMKLVDLPMPEAGPGQVLVRIKAVSLNYRDLLTVRGGYGSRQKFPLIPLSDGAGVVETIGPGVTGLKVGDRVVSSFFESWHGGEAEESKLRSALGGALDGVLCEYRVFPEHAVVKAPAHLSDAAAATLPCAALTAWSAVVKCGQVKPGDVVLTQGTGGVSLFALQFAKLAGARVIATSSSDAKIEKLKLLGADETINYKTTPEWGKLARSLSGRGVDIVVEVGGVGTLNESIRATRIGGMIGFIGVLAGQAQSEPRISLMVMQQQRLQGVTVGSIDDLKAMIAAIALHKLEPVVDRVFPFAETKDAFAYMATGAHVGKIAITIP